MILVRVRRDHVLELSVRAELFDLGHECTRRVLLGSRVDEHFGIAHLDERTVPDVFVPEFEESDGEIARLYGIGLLLLIDEEIPV